MPNELFNYLNMGILERIDHKDKTGKSFQDIFNSTLPEPIKGDFCSNRDIMGAFDFSYSSFYKYCNDGVFGNLKKVGKRVYYETSIANSRLRTKALSFSSKDFEGIIDKYYMSYTWFQETFLDKFYKRLDGKFAIDVVGAAKIFWELKRRKEAVEEWKTFGDLSDDLGSRLNSESLINYYRNDVNDGKFLKIHRSNDCHVSNSFRIPPLDYNVMLEEQKRRFDGMSVIDISEKYGLNRRSVRERVKYAKSIGLINPSSLPFSTGGYTLAQDDVTNLFSDRINGYTSLRVENMKNLIPNLQNFLIKNPDPLDRRVSLRVKKELFSRARRGDSDSMSILLKLYEPLIHDVSLSSYGIINEDRRTHAIRSFYEIVRLSDFSNFSDSGIRNELSSRVKKYIRNEYPSWLSLDIEVGVKGDKVSLVGLLSEEHVKRVF